MENLEIAQSTKNSDDGKGILITNDAVEQIANLLKSQKDKVVLERSYGIARRLGFPQIPLACVCIRYLNLMLSTPFCLIKILGFINFNFLEI